MRIPNYEPGLLGTPQMEELSLGLVVKLYELIAASCVNAGVASQGLQGLVQRTEKARKRCLQTSVSHADNGRLLIGSLGIGAGCIVALAQQPYRQGSLDCSQGPTIPLVSGNPSPNPTPKITPAHNSWSRRVLFKGALYQTHITFRGPCCYGFLFPVKSGACPILGWP